MKIWDPIRCLHVAATPEEQVRQRWIRQMIGPLGYPKGLLSVEKDLASLPYKRQSFDPNRRIDLLCFTPHGEGLTPLLLVEFKAEALGDAGMRQLLGYNEMVQAPFVCMVQGDTASTFWKEGKNLGSVPFLPSYSQLLAKL